MADKSLKTSMMRFALQDHMTMDYISYSHSIMRMSQCQELHPHKYIDIIRWPEAYPKLSSQNLRPCSQIIPLLKYEASKLPSMFADHT